MGTQPVVPEVDVEESKKSGDLEREPFVMWTAIRPP